MLTPEPRGRKINLSLSLPQVKYLHLVPLGLRFGALVHSRDIRFGHLLSRLPDFQDGHANSPRDKFVLFC